MHVLSQRERKCDIYLLTTTQLPRSKIVDGKEKVSINHVESQDITTYLKKKLHASFSDSRKANVWFISHANTLHPQTKTGFYKQSKKVSKKGEAELVKVGDLKTGVDLCLRNAERLIKDGELLFEHKSYGHATSLVYLGLEELGKALRLAEACFLGKEVEDTNDVFRFHKDKMGIATGAMLSPAIVEAFRTYTKEKPLTEKSLRKFVQESELLARVIKAIPETDKRRKACLYVDSKNGEWHSPFEIRREEAKSSVDFGRQYMAKIGFLCKILIKATPLRDKIYSQYVKSLKRALDVGGISQELYDLALSEWEALRKK